MMAIGPKQSTRRIVRWLLIAGSAALLASSCILDRAGLEGAGGGGGTGGDGGSTPCMTADECPDDNPCGTPVCDGVACGYELLPVGTVCSDAMDMICNAEGACVEPVAYPCDEDPNVCPEGFFCVDEVCCNEACEGPCERCNLAGLAGVCNPLEAGSNPPGACSEGVCDGGGECAVGDDVWHEMIAVVGDQFLLDIAAADDGSVYLVGSFTTAFPMPGGGPTINPIGIQNGVLVKLDSNGVYDFHQLFEHTFGGLTGVVTQGSDVFVGGWYDGVMTVNGQTYDAGGDRDVFVAKLTSTGEITWLETYGGTGADFSGRIAVHGAGNVTLSGRNTGGTFIVGSDIHMNQGGDDAFLLRLDPNGESQWLRWYGGSGDQIIWDIDGAPGGDVAVAGMTDTAFDAGNGMIEYNAGRDVWAARIAATGATLWARGFGGTQDDEARVARFGDGDRVWIGGMFDTAINFDAAALAVSNNRQAFFVELSAGGTAEQALDFGTDADHEELWQAERTAGGGWVLAGIHETEWEISSDITLPNNGSGNDAFVLKLGPNLVPLWAYAVGSDGQPDFINRLAVDPDDHVLLVAVPGDNFTWFGETEMVASSLDSFIAKLSP